MLIGQVSPLPTAAGGLRGARAIGVVRAALMGHRDAMVDELILHIGHPKTGTSSLQETFSDNRRALLDHGLYYQEGFHHRIAHHFDGGRRSHGDRGKVSALLRDLRRTRARQAMVSSEVFYRLDEAGIARTLEAFSPHARSIRVLLYVREPVAAATSAVHQGLRSGRTLQSLLARPWVVRVAALVTRWRAAVGADAVTVRPYRRDEDARWDVVGDALEVIGQGGLAPSLERRRRNEGLSVLAAHLLDQVNRERVRRSAPQLPVGSLAPFGRIPGPRYLLPPDAQEAARRAGRPGVEWLEGECGIRFRPAAAGPAGAHEPPLSEPELRSLARSLLLSTQFAYEVERAPVARLFSRASGLFARGSGLYSRGSALLGAPSQGGAPAPEGGRGGGRIFAERAR